jgi:hypothetical protein
MIKDIRGALRTFLLADAGISTAVNALRIYPGIIAQGQTLPSIVYNLVSEVTDQHMQGASGLVAMRLQIDAWALTSDLADSLARLVKDRMDGFRGEWPYGSNSPRDIIEVQGVFSQNARTDYDTTNKLHGVSRDYIIHFGER